MSDSVYDYVDLVGSSVKVVKYSEVKKDDESDSVNNVEKELVAESDEKAGVVVELVVVAACTTAVMVMIRIDVNCSSAAVAAVVASDFVVALIVVWVVCSKG